MSGTRWRRRAVALEQHLYMKTVAWGRRDGGRGFDRRPAPVVIPSGNAYIPAMSTETPPPRPCVICGKPQVTGHGPFCSRRCADVDLHRWLAGVYAIPAKEEDPDDPASEPAGDAGDT
jgi:uncharacterized protein